MLKSRNLSNKNMRVFCIFSTNHKVLPIKSNIFPKCPGGAQYNKRLLLSVRYTEVFLWEFEHDSASSLKDCLLLPGVRCIACPL